MAWIADANPAVLALWASIALTGIATGIRLSRWSDSAPVSPRDERLQLAAAAAGVVAWCATAGAVAGNSSSNALLIAHVPIETGLLIRLAVLWSTLPGAALTLAVILLVLATFSGHGDGNSRFVGAITACALLALGASAWFTPEVNVAGTVIPPFVQSTSAALAPLFALLAVVGLTVIATLVLSNRAPASLTRTVVIGQWIAASAAVVSEQVARSQLGIGPRDAVVLGSASSGLILWLVTSALLHRRIQGMLFRVPRSAEAVDGGRRARLAAHAGHAGALCIAISFAAHAVASRSTVALPPGASIGVTDAFRRTWHLVNQGVSRFDADGVDVTALAVEARSPTGRIGLVTPEVREYHGRDGQHLATPVSLRRQIGGPAQTMRVLLTETDSLDVARVRVTFLPAPILWPTGVAFLALSALLVLSVPESRLVS